MLLFGKLKTPEQLLIQGFLKLKFEANSLAHLLLTNRETYQAKPN